MITNKSINQKLYLRSRRVLHTYRRFHSTWKYGLVNDNNMVTWILSYRALQKEFSMRRLKEVRKRSTPSVYATPEIVTDLGTRLWN